MEHKQVTVELKAGSDETGEFRAVIATFNRIDHDGDVTLPGAFPEGKVVPISAYGHTSWQGSLPVGKGTIHQDDERAWIDGRFFLDTTPGKETYITLKRLVAEDDGPAASEWSYGYDATETSTGAFEEDGTESEVRFLKGLDVHEASPVLLGAGIGTGTIDIKSRPFAEQGEETLKGVIDFVERARSLAALRAQDGRELSGINIDRLKALGAALTEAVEMIDGLLPVEEEELADAGSSALHARALEARATEARIRAEGVPTHG